MTLWEAFGAAAGHVVNKARERALAAQQAHLQQNQTQSQSSAPAWGQQSTSPAWDQKNTSQPWQQNAGYWQPGPVSHSFWGSFIAEDKRPSNMYCRLLDAIFNLADRTHPPQNSNGLEPTKSSWLYDELGAQLDDNAAKVSLQIATHNCLANPNAAVNQILTLYYTALSLSFSVGPGAVPILTREGFYATMVMDSLINPAGQIARLNHVLSQKYAHLLDPQTNQPFPQSVIPRDALPAGPDQQVLQMSQAQKTTFQVQVKAYLAMAAGGGAGVQGMGGGFSVQATGGGFGMQQRPQQQNWQDLRQMQNFLHHQTMSGMSAGYWTPGGSGGYTFHNTGGLQW